MSTHHERPDGVVERLQVGEYGVSSESAKRSDVLSKYPRGSHLAHQPQHLHPQSASLACDACAIPGERDVLTGEAPGDDVDMTGAPSNKLNCEGSDVIVAVDLGPVLPEYGLTVGFRLAEHRSLEAARAFEAERDAAYP